MTRLKSTVLGFYIPSFFEMHVNTSKDDMTINQLPLKDMTTLFHEYIHFLQDFTTIYGLGGIYVHSEYLHSVVNRIYNVPTKEFKVPFVINDNNDNVLLNKQIAALTLGDTSECITFEISDIVSGSDPLIKNPYLESVPNEIIISKNGDMWVFGAMAIMESMAYIMERCASPKGYVSSPEFPYMAAEKVANFIAPGFSDDPLMVLALCDMSLMSSNPGACFLRVMRGVRDGALHFDKPEDIYDHFYDQVAEYADGRPGSLLLSDFKKQLKVIESQLKSYLRDLPIVNAYYEWIDRLVAFALDWRENDRCFLLKMARHDDLATNGCFGYAISKVGTPLMSNNNPGAYYKITPEGATLDMDVEYLKAIHEIENVFLDASHECSMFVWCKNSPHATANELCQISPWAKCREEKLCPFALAWRHWNLGGRTPKP